MTSDSTHTEALLPCEHCGCRFGYHEAGCAALIDDIVSVAVTGFKADVERIMAEHPETKPGDMTREQQCMMVAEASGWRARALKAEAEIARRTPPPTTDVVEREAVARAVSQHTYAVAVGDEDCSDWPEMSERAQNVYREAADAALSALAPYRTTERATEYARGLADGVKQSEAAIVAWLRGMIWQHRDHQPAARLADRIVHREHAEPPTR